MDLQMARPVRAAGADPAAYAEFASLGSARRRCRVCGACCAVAMS